MIYFIGFILSFILSLTLTPIFIKIAKKYKIMDYPDERKIHSKPVPYLGGLSIYLSFIILFFIGMYFFGILHWDKKNIVLMISSFLILLLGLYDDTKRAKPLFKLTIQIFIALYIALSGILIDRITNPFGGTIFFPYWLSIVITIFWIVGMINAINLIDGLDGLASGVIAISSIFIFIIAFIKQNVFIAYITSIFSGAVGGFLIYNFPPAKIFMGDTGSMFLGLIFSFFAIVGNRKSAVAINLLIPLILLTLPIIDTILAIIRRANKRKNIFQADKEHIHHRLLNLGIPYKTVIILIYLFCVYLGLISLISIKLSKEFTFILMFIIGMNIFIGLYVLKIIEKYIKK